MSKPKKLFVSHSTEDKAFVNELVELLRKIGFTPETLFCSSVPSFGIKLNEDIIETLNLQYEKYDLYILFIFSNCYYDSAYCLNEMGAAWILKNDYTCIAVSGFDFGKAKGVIKAEKIGICMDNDDCKQRLNELKDKLVNDFNLYKINENLWEADRDKFIAQVKSPDANRKEGVINSSNFNKKEETETVHTKLIPLNNSGLNQITINFLKS